MNEASVTEAVEAMEAILDAEAEQSSRLAHESSRLTFTVAPLHTSQFFFFLLGSLILKG